MRGCLELHIAGRPYIVRLMQWATAAERTALGQARRKQIGRQKHNECNTKSRKTSSLVLLQRSMKGRVAGLVKHKYELMAESPFGYFRGAVPVMVFDLAAQPSTGIMAQRLRRDDPRTV